MSGWRARDRRLQRLTGGVPPESGGERPDTLPADIPVEKWALRVLRDYTGPPRGGGEDELTEWLQAVERHIRFRFGILAAERSGMPTPFAWISDPPRLTDDQSERVAGVVEDFLEDWRAVMPARKH